MMKALRLLLPLCLAFSTASCSSCRNEADETTDAAGPSLPTVQIPNSAAALTRAFAERLDGETRALLVARDFSELLADYPEIRPRVAPLVGDIGMIETDVRNTLGVDITRPETLESVGIAARGGAALAMVGRQPLVMIYLSNPATFQAHATTVLSQQPFALSAPVEQTSVGSAQLLTFRRQPDGPAKIMIALDRGMAYLMPDVGEDRVATMQRLTSPPGPSGRLSDNVSLDGAIDRFDGYSIFGWLTFRGLAEDTVARYEGDSSMDEARRTRLIAETRQGGRAGELAFGLSINGDRIDYRHLLTPDEQLLAIARAVLSTDSANPSFARLVGSDAYALARLSIDLGAVLTNARVLLPDGMQDDVVDTLALLDQRLGMATETELIPALGHDILALATRARLLTLRRVFADLAHAKPGEVGAGFGLIVALEVRDRAVVERAVRTVATALAERVVVEDIGGNVVLRFTDAESDVGNLVLTDEFLIIVPERNREDLLTQLGSGSNDQAIADEAARRIVSDPSATGIYLNVAQMLEGPIGQAASGLVPEVVMSALRNIGVVHARLESTDAGLLAEASVVFAPIAAPAAPTAPAAPATP